MRHARLLMLAVVLAVALVTGALGYAMFTSGEQQDRNETALLALCATRSDLDQRIERERRTVARTARLLRAEKGPLIFSIPRRLIVDSWEEQKATLAQSLNTRQNLAILDCEEEPSESA